MGAACGAPWSEAWGTAQKLIKKHGVLPPLYDALRAMQPVMNSHGSDKNARVAIDRALYFETHLPIDLAACAAGVVKRDMRTMDGLDAAAWQGLLALGMGAQHAEPKATWVTKTGTAIAKLGHDELRTRLGGWLEQIGTRTTLALSPAGADAARTLVWLAVYLDGVDAHAALFSLAGRDWTRGPTWGPRHDRFVGALAYALGETRSRPAEARIAVDKLEPRFRHSTARYAIVGALAKLPQPLSA